MDTNDSFIGIRERAQALTEGLVRALGDVLRIVEADRAPTSAQTSELSSELQSLIELHERARSEARRLRGTEAQDGDWDPTLTECLDLIEDARLTGVVSEARAALAAFAAIESDFESARVEIAPFAQRALERLASLESATSADADRAREASAQEARFLEVMRSGAEIADDWALITDIAQDFSFPVALGLVQHRYHEPQATGAGAATGHEASETSDAPEASGTSDAPEAPEVGVASGATPRPAIDVARDRAQAREAAPTPEAGVGEDPDAPVDEAACDSPSAPESVSEPGDGEASAGGDGGDTTATATDEAAEDGAEGADDEAEAADATPRQAPARGRRTLSPAASAELLASRLPAVDDRTIETVNRIFQDGSAVLEERMASEVITTSDELRPAHASWSKFKAQCHQMPMSSSFVIPVLSRLCALTVEQIVRLARTMDIVHLGESAVAPCLEWLASKGIAARYRVGPESYWSATPYGAALMRIRSFRKLEAAGQERVAKRDRLPFWLFEIIDGEIPVLGAEITRGELVHEHMLSEACLSTAEEMCANQDADRAYKFIDCLVRDGSLVRLGAVGGAMTMVFALDEESAIQAIATYPFVLSHRSCMSADVAEPLGFQQLDDRWFYTRVSYGPDVEMGASACPQDADDAGGSGAGGASGKGATPKPAKKNGENGKNEAAKPAKETKKAEKAKPAKETKKTEKAEKAEKGKETKTTETAEAARAARAHEGQGRAAAATGAATREGAPTTRDQAVASEPVTADADADAPGAPAFDAPDTADEVARVDGPRAEGPVEDSATEPATVAGVAEEARGVEADAIDFGRILDADGTPDEDAVRLLLAHLLRLPATREGEEDFDGVAMALALAGAFELQGSRYARTLRAGLVLACDSPAADAHYSGQDLRSAFPEHTVESAPIELAAWCRALFNPEGQDWVLYNTARAYFDGYEDYFGAYPEVRPLFALLMRTKECSVEHGFTKRVIGAIADRSAWSANLDAVRSRARDLRQIPDFKSSFVGVPQLARALFGKDSEIGRAMRVIERDDLKDKELVRAAVAPFVRQASVEAIEPEAVRKKIRDTWAEVRRRTRSGATFGHETFERAIAEYTSRLQVAVTWLALSESGSDEATARFSSLRKDLLAALPEVRASLVAADDGGRPGIALLILLCDSIADVLAGDYHSRVPFTGFLRTGYVSLDDDLQPILDAQHAQVTFFEPWRRVLAHVCAEHPTMADALAATLDDESETFDNLRQQRQLERLLGREQAHQDPGAARAAALDDERRFMSDLEMWFAYARIGEETRERLERAATALRDQLFSVGDFGMWRRLLACLTRQAALEGERQETALAERLAEAESQQTSAPILAEARRMLDQDNLALAEEYLLRFEAGEWELAPSLADSVSDANEFASFMDQLHYTSLFDEAFATRDTRPFPRVARQYLTRVAGDEGWPQARLTKARSIFDNWPKEQGADLDASRMGRLLHSLGLEVRQCWVADDAGETASDDAVSRYRAAFEPWDPTKATSHPVSALGSRRPEEVDVCLVRSFTSPTQIAQLVEAHRAGGLLVVVVDERLTRTQRREVAELHMAGKRLTQFLLIDRVLALHLSTHVVEERLRVLLKCALPFTSLQPFVNGEGAVPEEMFVGRSDELREIMSPEGTSLVYGGRQLGKSALLMQAARLAHDPQGKRYAVYVDVRRCADEESFATTVAEHVFDAGFHSVKPGDVRTIADLGRALKRSLQARKVKGKATPRRSLLLLIDEADAILAALAPERYEALGPLIGLQRSPEVSFKFVLAGTHDVIRAKNADAANGVLGQIGNPCCIRPLPPQEALRLIMRPLMYVGVTIEDRSHLEMILANTNYYPGIVQLFGHNLVASIPSKFGGTYAAAKGNPPYVVDERQLGQAMFAHDLAREIKRKFLMTLELDEHGRYLEICRLVCYLTLERESDGELYLEGFAAEDLYQNARAWEVPALADETVSSLATLLEELCDMGILARRGKDPVRYGMRRHKFLDYIGTMDDILQAFQSFEGR